VGIVGLGLLAWQLQLQMRTRKEEKLTNLDEDAVRDILGEEEEKDRLQKEEDAKNRLKAKNSLKLRLAQERKARSGKKHNQQSTGDDDEDDAALNTFANKGATKKNSKAKKG